MSPSAKTPTPVGGSGSGPALGWAAWAVLSLTAIVVLHYGRDILRIESAVSAGDTAPISMPAGL